MKSARQHARSAEHFSQVAGISGLSGMAVQVVGKKGPVPAALFGVAAAASAGAFYHNIQRERRQAFQARQNFGAVSPQVRGRNTVGTRTYGRVGAKPAFYKRTTRGKVQRVRMGRR